MVTVNSTVGLRAIVLGRPVKALGRAVWDVPGLAHQGPLDRFWADAAPPDTALRDDFLRALQATTQVRGVFYAEGGRTRAVAETVARLHAGRVGMAMAAPDDADPGCPPAPVFAQACRNRRRAGRVGRSVTILHRPGDSWTRIRQDRAERLGKARSR